MEFPGPVFSTQPREGSASMYRAVWASDSSDAPASALRGYETPPVALSRSIVSRPPMLVYGMRSARSEETTRCRGLTAWHSATRARTQFVTFREPAAQ